MTALLTLARGKALGHIKHKSILSISVEEAATEFLASIEYLSVRTQQDYAQRLTVFAHWCADNALTLRQIDHKTVSAFVAWLKASKAPLKPGATELSSYTLVGYVRVIKTFLNWCIESDEFTASVSANAVQKIKKPKIDAVIIDTFTPEQMTALFAACGQEESLHLQMRDRALLAVLIDTGVRASELIRLRISQVCLERDDAHIRVYGTKGHAWREIGLGRDACKYLRAYIREFREPTIAHDIDQALKDKNLTERQRLQARRELQESALLFVNRAGEPLTTHGLGQIITRLSRFAGIDHDGVRCSPHTFRHTFAVTFMRHNNDIYRLSKLLGHSSVAVTEAYLKSFRQAEARQGAPSVLDTLQGKKRSSRYP